MGATLTPLGGNFSNDLKSSHEAPLLQGPTTSQSYHMEDQAPIKRTLERQTTSKPNCVTGSRSSSEADKLFSLGRRGLFLGSKLSWTSARQDQAHPS